MTWGKRWNTGHEEGPAHLEVVQAAVALGIVADKAHLQGCLWIFHHSGRDHNRGYGVLSLVV